MRLLLWIFQLLMLFFVIRLGGIMIRSFFGGLTKGSRPAPPPPPGPDFRANKPVGQVEELVKDPICGVHTARSSAIPGRFQGREAFFCSQECAAKAANAS